MEIEFLAADFEEEISRLQQESLMAIIEVIIRDALVLRRDAEDVATTLSAAIDDHICAIIERICSEREFVVLH